MSMRNKQLFGSKWIRKMFLSVIFVSFCHWRIVYESTKKSYAWIISTNAKNTFYVLSSIFDTLGLVFLYTNILLASCQKLNRKLRNLFLMNNFRFVIAINESIKIAIFVSFDVAVISGTITKEKKKWIFFRTSTGTLLMSCLFTWNKSFSLMVFWKINWLRRQSRSLSILLYFSDAFSNHLRR